MRTLPRTAGPHALSSHLFSSVPLSRGGREGAPGPVLQGSSQKAHQRLHLRELEWHCVGQAHVILSPHCLTSRMYRPSRVPSTIVPPSSKPAPFDLVWTEHFNPQVHTRA